MSQLFQYFILCSDLIKSLLFRIFSLCSDFVKCYHEVDKLKSILCKNNYPCVWLSAICIKEFLGKMLAPITTVITVPKKDLVIALPYLGKFSLQINTRINCILKNRLPLCEKCAYSELFWSAFFRIWTEYGKIRISPYSVRM